MYAKLSAITSKLPIVLTGAIACPVALLLGLSTSVLAGEWKREPTQLATAASSEGALRPPALPRSNTPPGEIFFVADSVVLGAEPTIRKGLEGWRIEFVGRPALTLRAATEEVRKRDATRSIPPVAVIALGYNSLWEKERRNFGRWAERFDREAEAMIAALKSRGAQKVIWVLLREVTLDNVPKGREREVERSWYFPYVNERLRALVERTPDVVLADWATAGSQPGLTYDFIHLNTKGSKLMFDVLKVAIGIETTLADSQR